MQKYDQILNSKFELHDKKISPLEIYQQASQNHKGESMIRVIYLLSKGNTPEEIIAKRLSTPNANVLYNGQTMNQKQLFYIINHRFGNPIKPHIFRERTNAGWPIEKAMKTRQITIDDHARELQIKAGRRHNQLSLEIIKNRIKRGWTDEQIINRTPHQQR